MGVLRRVCCKCGVDRMSDWCVLRERGKCRIWEKREKERRQGERNRWKKGMRELIGERRKKGEDKEKRR